jgi:ferric-dicitrate binding protein FerR (iron transport regulator)
MWIKRATFDEHTANDAAQFAAIIASLKAHDANVDHKHVENQAALGDVRASQEAMKTSLEDIIKLRPAIEAGIAADKAAEFEDKLAAQRRASRRRIFTAIVSTAAAVGGLIPLVQWLATIHVQLHIG